MSPSPTHSLEPFFQYAREIWSEREDVRIRCGSPDALIFWNWLMSEGWKKYPRLSELLPIPPQELIARVHGDATDAEFQESGLANAWNIFLQLEELGFDFAKPARVLDFGCGCGRLLRVFARFVDALELHGADIDPDAIAWNRDHLGFGRYEVLSQTPPSPYEDSFFHAVYSFSVFSHLPEELHRNWLHDLRRITAPGALLVITIQGLSCAERFARNDASGLPFPSQDQMQHDLPRLRSEGFLYYAYEATSLPGELAEQQGMTFITEEYIKANWLDGFELLKIDFAPQGWQDVVVLKRV